MEPHHNPLQNLTWGHMNDIVYRLRIENPDLDPDSLPLSELLRINKRSNQYHSRTMHNVVQTKPSQVLYGEEENDGDDEYEDDAEEPHLQAATPLPSPHLSKPLPPSPKPHSPTPHDEPHAPGDSEHHPPPLLQKGSDGLHDIPTPSSHYNSIFGGPRLSTVHAQIKASILSHTTAQIKLLRQRKLDRAASKRKEKLNRAATKRGASPQTSSTKGSPLPWPTSPVTPVDENKIFPPHRPNTPFSPLALDALRTQSESPQRSRTVLRKQKARLSTPIQDLSPPTPPILSPDGGVESGTERGRTRLRKEKPSSRNEHDDVPRGKEGLKISRPMLQHPIMIPVVSLELANELASPGKGRVGSPLVEEQRVSSGDEGGVGEAGAQNGGVGGQYEGGVGCDAGEAAEGDVGRERRRAALLEGMLDLGTGPLLDEEIFWRLG